MSCSLPEVSSSRASVIGRLTSFEKNEIFWSWLSSIILKSSCFRSPTIRLFLSRTVANTFTRFTCDRITGPCPASCGPAGTDGTASIAALLTANHTLASLLKECMYTFLCENPLLLASGGQHASYDAVNGRDGCVARILERLNRHEVWLEAHEKS